MLEEITRLLSREVKDPRIPSMTVTKIELTEDAECATVYFTLLGSLIQNPDETESERESRDLEIEECRRGLSSSAPFLRRSLAKAMGIRHIPELRFKPDRGLENVTRVNELLRAIDQEKEKEKHDPEGRGSPH